MIDILTGKFLFELCILFVTSLLKEI